MNAIERALRVASRQTDTNPSEKQKEASNYKKGRAQIHGLTVAIENPKGSERSGIDRDGKPWKCVLPAHYGDIKRTTGADGDAVDCYIGPDHDSDKVFIVDQVDAKTGKFDEHKCCLSYPSKDAALADYTKAFSDGKGQDRIGHVTEMSVNQFKSWLKHGNTRQPLVKGFAHGGAVRGGEAQMSSDRDRKISQAIALAMSVVRKGQPKKAGGGGVSWQPGDRESANVEDRRGQGIAGNALDEVADLRFLPETVLALYNRARMPSTPLPPSEMAAQLRTVGNLLPRSPLASGGAYASPAPSIQDGGSDASGALFGAGAPSLGSIAQYLPQKADGGGVSDDPDPLGPMGSDLSAAMKFAPKSTVAALSRLSPAKSFEDLVAQNPHGWGRTLPDPGSITADTPPSALDRALAIAEAPAKAYAGQFNSATGAVADAMRHPDLPSLTNAGVQTGLAVGSPELTLGSGALGFGTAALQDLFPSVVPSAEAKTRRPMPSLRPSIMEPAEESAGQQDDLAAKVAGDPQLEVLYSAYKQAQAKAGAEVPGLDSAHSEGIRQRFSDQATAIMGQIANALATREKGKSDLAKQNYDQQVNEAVGARDATLSRGTTFEDTNTGKVYRGLGGLGPLVAGMVPGAMASFAKGPAESWLETGGRLLSGASMGAGASLMPLGYDMSYAPVENPEKKAMEAYAFNLPDGHPDKAKAQAAAATMPDINPVHKAALDEFSDPSALAKRAGWGAVEGATGAEVGDLLPRFLGGVFKRDRYGFTPPGGPGGGAGGASADLPDLPWPSAGASGARDLPDLPAAPGASKASPIEELGSSGNQPRTDASPAQSAFGSPSTEPSPALQRALTVARQQSEKASSSPVFSPDDLASDKASKILKEFPNLGVNQWQHGDQVVHRIAPGNPDAGQFTVAPQPPKASTKAVKGKGKLSVVQGPDDVPTYPGTDIAIKPPKELDMDDPINRGRANGGLISRAMDVAKRYARGGVVVGPVIGKTGGRADALPVDVPANSFVWPADVVAGRGQGNTEAGQQFLARLEQHVIKKTGGRVSGSRAQGGPSSSAVPIKISHGERVSPPDIVAAFGGGDMDHGNRVMDHLVKHFRAEDIKTLSNLPPPSK